MATLDEDIFAEIMAAPFPQSAADHFHQVVEDALKEALASFTLQGKQHLYTREDPAQPADKRSILPFGRDGKWSPLNVRSHPMGSVWLTGQAALVCWREDMPRTGPSRVIFTHVGLNLDGIPKELEEQNKIGARFHARHDQTGQYLGLYRVVGVVLYGVNGEVFQQEGDIPRAKISCAVYK